MPAATLDTLPDMFYKPILLPLLAQVALTFGVWFYMYFTRIGEIQRKRISTEELADGVQARSLLTQSAGPAENFRNLFEMPVLFYLAVVLSLMLLIQDQLLITLAWIFVFTRVVHSFIHCTYNRVMHRFTVYVASCAILFLIWLRLAWYVVSF
jgi:hypothetical protein